MSAVNEKRPRRVETTEPLMAGRLLEGHMADHPANSYAAVGNESVFQFTDVNVGLKGFRQVAIPGLSRKARTLPLGYSAAMETQDDNESDDATCDTCGRKLTLLASLPRIGNRPRRRLYKCVPCQKVITIPPD